MKVCFSGFESEERGKLAFYVKELGLQIEQGMTFQVNVLVCNSVRQDKYKVAKILGIPVVSSTWVYKSFEAGKPLDPNLFPLKMFKRCSFSLHAFSEEEFEQCRSLIIENEGEIRQDNADLAIVRTGKKFHINTDTITVTSDWIVQCKERNEFVPVLYYQINSSDADKMAPITNFDHKSIPELYQNTEYDFFYKQIFYIHVKDPEIVDLIQNIISIGQGTYIMKLFAKCTHIVTLEPVDYLGIQHQVHPAYIIDCLYYRKLLNPFDYRLIKNYQPKIEPLFIQNNDEQRTGRFGLRSSSISMTSFGNNLQSNKFSAAPGKNQLFILCFFFIYDDPSLDKSLLPLIAKFGGLYEMISQKSQNLKGNKDRPQNIILLPDSPISRQAYDYIEKRSSLQNKYYFHYRWLQYSIEQKMVELEIREKKLYHLLYTTKTMPMAEFKHKSMSISIRDTNKKVVIKALVRIISGQNDVPFSDNIHYFICDHQCKKLLRIKEDVEIKAPDWLLSIFSGK